MKVELELEVSRYYCQLRSLFSQIYQKQLNLLSFSQTSDFYELNVSLFPSLQFFNQHLEEFVSCSNFVISQMGSFQIINGYMLLPNWCLMEVSHFLLELECLLLSCEEELQLHCILHPLHLDIKIYKKYLLWHTFYDILLQDLLWHDLGTKVRLIMFHWSDPRIRIFLPLKCFPICFTFCASFDHIWKLI